MLRILVVDDTFFMRKSLIKIFTSLGLEVVGEAENGYEAIKKYKLLVPDLVTMDISMPPRNNIKNGIEALRLILELDKDAKIAMVTTHGEESLVMEAIRSGAKGYILKPIKGEKIVKLITKIFPDYVLDLST